MTNERQIVIPGEKISEGDALLPGEGTEKRTDGVYALKFGLSEESGKLIKVIPLSGAYKPRRGNVIVGTVVTLMHNGWFVNIGPSDDGFIGLGEVPQYVNKDNLEEVLEIGDVVVAKIWNIGGRGIDLSLKSRGLGKVDAGIVVKVNPNKVPRVIGKEGSMIKLIKDETGCNITVGQNGYAVISGEKIEDELFAKKAILYVTEKSCMTGLTEEMTKWFKENKGAKK